MSADNENSEYIKLAVIGWREFNDYTHAKKCIGAWIRDAHAPLPSQAA